MRSSIIDNNPNQPKMSIAAAADFLGISGQAIHKQLKGRGLQCPKLGNKSFITYEIARELFGLIFTPKKIAGQIVKGGTGKTTTIDNIASCANTYGARVLMIDADPQGNLTDAYGIDPDNMPVLVDIINEDVTIEESIHPISNGFSILPSRVENVVLDNEIVNKRLPLDKLYSNILSSVENQYDFIFIDCPPTMGQSVAAATLYSNIVLAPLNPDKFSAKGLNVLKQEIANLNKAYGKNILYKVYLNKFSNKTILSDKAIVSLVSDPDLEGKVLSTSIQATQEIPNLTSDNQNAFSTIKKSLVREDFDALTRELLDIRPENQSSNFNKDLAEIA